MPDLRHELIYDTPEAAVYLTEIEGAGSRTDREREAVGRLLREVFPDADPQVDHAPTGAPVVVDRTTCAILAPLGAVSISHSRRFAVVALSRTDRNIGVDIEEERQQLPRIVHKFLSDSEYEAYCPAETRVGETTALAALLRAWTAKEALYKAALIPGLSLRDSIHLPSPDFTHPAAVAVPAPACAVPAGSVAAPGCADDHHPLLHFFRLISLPAPPFNAITLAISV